MKGEFVMQRRSLCAFTTALFVSFIFVDVASAYYNPRTGRFLSRDPIGEPGHVLVRSTASGSFIPRDPISDAAPNSYAALENAPLNWIDPDGLQTSRPSTQPADPVDICKLLGGKGCDGTDVAPGPVEIPINLLTVGKLKNLCGALAIKSVNSCSDNLKYKDIALAGGKPCSQIKMDVCKQLQAYATGKSYTLHCWKQEKDNWIIDPDKECCCKVKFNGTYDATVPVSITVPVGKDANGKNDGLCVITGNVKASLVVEGEFGQCQKKKKQ